MAAMAVSSPQRTDAEVEKRRKELYGSSKRDAVKKMKGALLTEDHVHMLMEEGHRTGNLPSWSSTTKTEFMGSQPRDRVCMSLDSGMQKVKHMQNSSHFSFRGDASPIDGAIYKSSLTNADYAHHQDAKKLPAVRLDPQVNLPDMNPRYWKDTRFGQSHYDTDFSEMIKRHNGPPPVHQTSELRRRYVGDLRSCHFHFGNDSQSYHTETGTSFEPSRPRSSGIRLDPLKHPRHRRAKTAPIDLTPAAVVQRMLAEERESYVFRNGDYNVKAPKEDISTFNRDYNARPKPNKAAAFVEPTQIAKGRFLQDKTELRDFIVEETKPWAADETLQKETVPESTISTLRQLFSQYDWKGSGYVSKPIMKRVLDSLLDPIPEKQLDHLLRFSQWGEDGAIDYNDFINNYKEMKPVPKSTEPDVLTVHTSHKEPSQDLPFGRYEKPPGTGMSAGANHGSPNLTTASEGKSYQTSVHFQFGNSTDKPSSIYNKDFDTAVQQDTTQSYKQSPPQASDVMHKVPGVGFGASTKQSSFVDFQKVDAERLRQILAERNAMSNKNKRRHDLNSVIMTCDPNRDAVDRQQSLSHQSYVTHTDSKPENPCEPHQPKYPFLKSDLALPINLHPLPKLSEARDAYTGPNISNAEEEQAKLQQFKEENRDRVKDGKRVHFKFGNDAPGRSTEAREQFTHNANGFGDVLPAGKLNAEDPNYAHFESSKNTRDLTGTDPMAPNNIERINIAKKAGFAAEQLLPKNISIPKSSSLMRHDYRPIEQRSFTDAQQMTIEAMDAKPIEPQPSHFFHTDSTTDNGMQSMSAQDYIRPELQ